jgi:hypothetical protein
VLQREEPRNREARRDFLLVGGGTNSSNKRCEASER